MATGDRDPSAAAPDAPWYLVAFGAHYTSVYPHRDDEEAARDVAFLLRVLEMPSGAVVLDLACGTGRHLSHLARAGLCAMGVDRSEELLKQAREQGLDVVCADMRRLPLRAGAFESVVNLFTSFGYFEDDAENARVLEEISRVLRPGGRFLIDHINADALRSELVPETRREGDGFTIIERRAIDPERRRVEKRVFLERNSRTHEDALQYVESVRYYRKDEMTEQLARAGLRAVSWHGSLRGDPFAPGAPRMVVVAEKRESNT